MKLSDYVINRVAEEVGHIFMLAGGGCMHLVDSVGRCKNLEYVCNLHEQACAIAAEAYAQYTGFGVALVTTGPGGTNTVTGVAAAWLDSTPCLFISGQVKTNDLIGDRGVRQMGFQEINIIDIVKPITKYAVTVTDPNSIRYHLDTAIETAKSGRPGPVWIDIPLDVQAANIREDYLRRARQSSHCDTVQLQGQVGWAIGLLGNAKRPVILLGNGARHSGYRKLIDLLQIPVLTTWKAIDFLAEDDSLFIGRPGAVGQWAGNLAQQKSDWFLMLGARMDLGQTAYMHKYLAPNAKKIMVDIDASEINKMQTTIDVPICADAKDFVDEFVRQGIKPVGCGDWWQKCRDWKESYPVTLPEYWEYEDGVSVYALVDAISDAVELGDSFIPGSSGTANEVAMHAFKAKEGVRVFCDTGLGSMGFGIPHSLGGCVASGGRTICLEGDGSFAMNTQELETIRRLELPIKFFVLDNGGYVSIRGTQRNYFEGRLCGSSEDSGLTLPDIEKIASAYGITFMEMESGKDIKPVVAEVMGADGAVICRVKVSPQQRTVPRVVSRQTESGGMETAPMEEMWPVRGER